MDFPMSDENNYMNMSYSSFFHLVDTKKETTSSPDSWPSTTRFWDLKDLPNEHVLF